MTADLREALKAADGRIPYRPSGGFEGADFIDRWCGRCKRDQAFRENDADSCSIVSMTMVVEIDSPDYPTEWRCDGPSGPRCTAFDPVDATDQPMDPHAAIGRLL